MRIFKSAWFVRFARAESISDDSLREAVHRASLGQVDADLGGSVIKQRISRAGQGRSGGYRAILLFRAGDRAFYVYGYAKNDRDNLRRNEEAQFKRMAGHVLALTNDQLDTLVATGSLEEVTIDDQQVS